MSSTRRQEGWLYAASWGLCAALPTMPRRRDDPHHHAGEGEVMAAQLSDQEQRRHDQARAVAEMAIGPSGDSAGGAEVPDVVFPLGKVRHSELVVLPSGKTILDFYHRGAQYFPSGKKR